MNIRELKPSLSHRSRHGAKVDTIILHATAGSTLNGALETLRKRGLSYHYIIAKDGEIVKCVPTVKTAYHAGDSVGPQGRWCNRYSIGISFVNLNNGVDPYTSAQIESCFKLINNLKWAISDLRYITTHAIVSPRRKTDPLGFDALWMAKATHLEFWRP